MRIAVLVRVPRWYSFRGDRLTRLIQQRGHEVAGIIVEPVPSGRFLQDLDRKFGGSMLLRKFMRAGLNWLAAHNRTSAHAGHACRRPPVYTVKSHNSAECAELLRSMAPDVILLRACGIIGPEILRIPKVGVLNAHYGQLPKYRGVYVTEWAILHGDCPVVTVHFVNEGVDSGDVLATRAVPLRADSTLASLRDESARVAGDLLADVLDDLDHGRMQRRKQRSGEGMQYFSMHPRIYAVAERKLRRLVEQ